MTKRYESFCQGLGYHPDEVKLSLRQPGWYLVHCCWAEICFGESVPYVEVLSSQLFAVFTRLSKEWCLQLFRLHSLGLNLVHGVTPLRNVVNANILILKPKYCDLFEYLWPSACGYVFTSKDCCINQYKRILCDFSSTRPDLQSVTYLFGSNIALCYPKWWMFSGVWLSQHPTMSFFLLYALF